jgi:hypothetical protein
VLVDQRAVVAGRVGVDSERLDPEVLAHRDAPTAAPDVVEARDLHLRVVVHPIHLRAELDVADPDRNRG